MTTGNISDRRQFAQELLESMAEQSSAERDEGLRRVAASVLGFTPVEGEIIAPEHPLLPPAATVVASLPNRYGPDYLALHFDLSARDGTQPRSYVTNAQVQVANGVAQRYAGEECYPLLVFLLPDDSGVQFVTGNPEPGNPYRLRDVARVSAYWNGNNRTALDCLERVGNAISNGAVPQRAFRDAFDVQPVTSEFFADYKAAYDTAVGRIAPSIGQTDAEQFTQTLFNRLLFIHFVSRKGWLQFNDDPDYLNALWHNYQANAGQSNFYNDRLQALFFAGLNNPQSMNLMRDNPAICALIGTPPFLNGGLFERTPLDDRAAAGEFAVPDEIIEHLITGLFNRYNFTVMEATPLDTEVAVDPEMLGKLFEETVNERHNHGAYYTPRPVVAFMCREAIKGYLAGRNIAGLDTASITDLVDNANPQAVTVAQAREIANAIAAMKAVDPACGSGAFLLGMLQEILAVNETIFAAAKQDPDSLYRQKLDIISNNIYGADKDGLAVSTAMLRLWLSLAVDYEGEGTPDPLPNLDMKLMTGDAIAGPDPQQLDFTMQSIVNSGLQQDIAAYTTAQGQRKTDLKDKVDATKRQLRENMRDAASEGVVEWRIDFADVMLNGGFDVVIANPPYVVTSDKQLREMYKEGVYGRANTYGLFIQRGLQLAGEGGQLSYINPRTLLTDRYFTNLRKVIKRHSELVGVVLIADRHNTFERVLQECIILRLVKRSSPPGAYLVNTRAIATTDDLSDPQTAVSVNSKRVLLPDAYGGAFFVGGSEFEYQAFERMNDAGVKLSSFGLKAETGKIQFDKYKDYAQADSADDACRLIWAENIQRYTRRPTRNRVGKEWLSKGIMVAVPPNITGAGIVTQRISANEQPRRIIATLIDPDNVGSQHVYSENHTNFIPLDKSSLGTFLIGALNSSPMEFAFRRLNSNTQVSAGEINTLPFPPIPDETKLKQIEYVVLALIAWGGVDCEPDIAKRAIEAERRLDILIGTLYGFTASEVEQIRGCLPSYETVYGLPERELASRKPPFVMTINHGGLAPGVTPENIKDIIFDQEDEEFLEKLNQ